MKRGRARARASHEVESSWQLIVAQSEYRTERINSTVASGRFPLHVGTGIRRVVQGWGYYSHSYDEITRLGNIYLGRKVFLIQFYSTYFRDESGAAGSFIRQMTRLRRLQYHSLTSCQVRIPAPHIQYLLYNTHQTRYGIHYACNGAWLFMGYYYMTIS